MNTAHCTLHTEHSHSAEWLRHATRHEISSKLFNEFGIPEHRGTGDRGTGLGLGKTWF